MSASETVAEAAEVPPQLGVKEHEARCFVGLSRMESATAKQLSEMTDTPRTRVYDASRVREAQSLVKIQHSSPEQFRAVPLDEGPRRFATSTRPESSAFTTPSDDRNRQSRRRETDPRGVGDVRQRRDRKPDRRSHVDGNRRGRPRHRRRVAAKLQSAVCYWSTARRSL